MTTQPSRTRNYLVGLASGYTVTIVTAFVGLWLTPFTLRFLDREQFAIFTLSSDLLMWLGLIDIGITSGLFAKAAKLTGKPDQHYLNRLTSTTAYAQIVIGFLALCVGIYLSFGFSSFFNVRPELQQDTIGVMC